MCLFSGCRPFSAFGTLQGTEGEKNLFRTREVCQTVVDNDRTNHWNSSVAVRVKNSVLVTDARSSFYFIIIPH